MARKVTLRPIDRDILARLSKLGLKQKDLAEALDIEQNKVSKVNNQDRHFSTEEVLQAREWLTEQETASSREPDLPPVQNASVSDETVEIIQLDLSLPMGPGATVDDYIEETILRFDLDYIRGFTRTPSSRLRLARGVGDSMYPTLISSDQVWIDSTQTVLNQQDRVWAVSINGAAAIKRLRSLKAGRILVVSDNPTIDNYEVDADEIMLGGRVIRFARDL